MFDGFRESRIRSSGAEIYVRQGGSGPPLLLLHGYPQTHLMWHAVADRISSDFTLVVPDLRGYGRSSKPASRPDHAPYSKRAMGQDMAEVMLELGYEHFGLVGHDRGGRVAHRLALDHPERVKRVMVLDIAPTREMYNGTDRDFASAYWHWFFLIQPSPLPERLIAADPTYFVLSRLGSRKAGLSPFAPEAVADYLVCFRDPETIHATCEDYRAAATIDIQHDDADGDRRLSQPLRAIWGEHGVIQECFDCLEEWRPPGGECIRTEAECRAFPSGGGARRDCGRDQGIFCAVTAPRKSRLLMRRPHEVVG
jgi:haloacetate dehalogenase